MNIPESTITVHRHPDTPHSFCPRMAERLGVIPAIVEYASRDISRKCIQPDNQIIWVPFTMSDIASACPYLSGKEIDDAKKVLEDAGIWGDENE